jgi:hypothetical protein
MRARRHARRRACRGAHEPYVDAVRATWDDDSDPLWLSVPGAEIVERAEWHRDFGLVHDAEGREVARDEHQLIAEFSIELTPGHEVTLVASTRAPAAGEAGTLPGRRARRSGAARTTGRSSTRGAARTRRSRGTRRRGCDRS